MLIDDASTDDSGKLADLLAAEDARARVIHLKTNGGLGPARNRGVRESIGKYVAFIDSDDWVKPDYLKDLVTAAERYQADVAFIGAERYFAKENGSWWVEPQDAIPSQEALLTPDKKRRFELYMAYRMSLTAWGRVIARKLFTGEEALHFEPILSEDTLFMLHLHHAAGTYVILPKRSYCYRQRSGSIMSSKSLAKGRRALETAFRVMPIIEHDIATWQECRKDANLRHQLRTWAAKTYLQFWLNMSEGQDGDAVLKEAENVCVEMFPEQAGMLTFLLYAWVRSLMDPEK